MYTPPSTKLIGDSLIELRDIRLQINKKKSELDIIQRNRKIVDSSSGFQERENSLRIREETNARLELKFDSVAGDAELYLEKVKEKIIQEETYLAEIVSKTERLKLEKVVIETDKTTKLEQLDKEIADKETYKKAIAQEILKDESYLHSKIVENRNLADENKRIKEESEVISSSLSKREQTVLQREINCENARSETRIWTTRLHNRYGHLMSEVETKLVPFEDV